MSHLADRKMMLDWARLDATAVRFEEHARKAAHPDIVRDLQAAARIARRLANLRSRVALVAHHATVNPEGWDLAAIAERLREALRDNGES